LFGFLSLSIQTYKHTTLFAKKESLCFKKSESSLKSDSMHPFWVGFVKNSTLKFKIISRI